MLSGSPGGIDVAAGCKAATDTAAPTTPAKPMNGAELPGQLHTLVRPRSALWRVVEGIVTVGLFSVTSGPRCVTRPYPGKQHGPSITEP
jgi:hypothetical protein